MSRTTNNRRKRKATKYRRKLQRLMKWLDNPPLRKEIVDIYNAMYAMLLSKQHYQPVRCICTSKCSDPCSGQQCGCITCRDAYLDAELVREG